MRALGPLCAAAVLLGPVPDRTPQGRPERSRAAAQEAPAVPAVVPPSGAVVQGVPPIPASVADQMNRYADYRTAHLVAWHPVRREMLIATRFGNTFQLHRVASPGGERLQVTFDDAGVSATGDTARAWLEPGSDHILYLRDVSPGKGLQQYFHLDPAADRKPTMVTDGAGRSLPGVWSPDGKRFAWTSNRRAVGDFDLYVMARHDPASLRLVAELKGSNAALGWTPDGRSLLVREFLSANESRLWLVDVERGARRQVSPEAAEPAAYGDAALVGDGASAFVVTDLTTEFLHVAKLDLASRALTPLATAAKGDVAELALSPDGRWLAFTVNQDAARTLHVIDTTSGTERTGLKVPAGDTSGLQWHPSGELGFHVQSARMPMDVFSWDAGTNTLTRWTTSETGALKPEDMREYEIIRWRSFDGRQISGILHRPATRFRGRRPVLVNIHGGPEDQARVFFWGRSNYFLNEAGVAIIQPNVRGSTGFGKTFMKLDDGRSREDALKDIGALLDWIGTQPGLDARRVWLVGNSYGGYLTLLAAAKYSARVRCAFIGSGMSNIATWLDHQPPDRVVLRRREYGDERDPETRKFLLDVSPLTHAHKIRTPLLIVHGRNDVQVPIEESQQIVDAVRKNDTPVWYIVFNDEGHVPTRRTNVDYVLYSWIAFAQEYLLK